METRTRSVVRVDVCPSCEGVWLDGGELSRLLAPGEEGKLLAEGEDKKERWLRFIWAALQAAILSSLARLL